MGCASYNAFHAQYVLENCKLHLSDTDFNFFMIVLNAYALGLLSKHDHDTQQSLVKLVRATDRILARDLRKLFTSECRLTPHRTQTA